MSQRPQILAQLALVTVLLLLLNSPLTAGEKHSRVFNRLSSSPSSAGLPIASAPTAPTPNCSVVNHGLPLNWISAGTLYTFVSTLLSPFSGTQYMYLPPVDGTQPWSFGPVNGGLAVTGSPFDPPPPIQAPNCPNYAFLQTMGNAWQSLMSAQLTGLSQNMNYAVEFYYGVRAGYNTSLNTLSVYYGSTLIWKTIANPSNSVGWVQAKTSTFKPATKDGTELRFQVDATSSEDHSILITSVSVTSSSRQ